ncbi:MAG: DUF1800 family protein [Pseudomonadota bacterium]|nr:DUF1800 family protein [Pseudomonadota bacterium]
MGAEAAEAVYALHRFGLGPRPGDIDRVAADPRGVLAAELDVPNAADLNSDLLTDSTQAYQEFRRAAANAREMLKQDARDPEESMGAESMGAESMDMAEGMEAEGMEPGAAPRGAKRKQPKETRILFNRLADTETRARIDRVLEAETGFVERLVAFWSNHFAIEIDAGSVTKAMAGAYEREAIRPHVLGRFDDLLFAATQHPAMLAYLNNGASVGPNSRGGQRSKRGLNENHAREILELHTVGVEGGYTQADVTALALVLTGWSFGRNVRKTERLGRFVFNRNFHEPGPQTVMGVRYEEEGALQGQAALLDLAIHPATSRHIAYKFARHFVADEPPAVLVDRLAENFLATEGDLKQLALTLIRSDEAWDSGQKLKSPQEFLWSSIRALQLPVAPGFAMRVLKSLGQPLWNPPSPEGYKDDTPTWLAPDAFADRLDVAERLAEQADPEQDPLELVDAVLGPDVSTETRETVRWAESSPQAFALLLMSPEFQWR